MNPSTAQARVIVDELARCGVRHVVLCPGSRNAPLSFALHDADADGRLELHVRIDERTAGFLALGMAVRGGQPAAVVCTSGTAAANLHPAVVEASHAGVPLLVLTADRPPELVGIGANQTIVQAGLYGAAVRLAQVFGVAERRAGQNALWRSMICRAVAAATGALTGDPGPVHLNLPFREPLIPARGPAHEQWPERLDGRDGGARWTTLSPRQPGESPERLEPAPTLVIAGHGAGSVLSGRSPGWPLIAEPGSGWWGRPGTLRTGPWLLEVDDFLASHLPARVLAVGRPTLHRSVQALLARDDVELISVPDRPGWTDVAGTAHRVLAHLASAGADDWPQEWAAGWAAADRAVARALDDVLDQQPWPSGVRLARELVAALPSGALLVLGSSNPVRDVALAAVARDDIVVLANRGAAGIDGMVSTAVGAALAQGGPAYALLGDLTFLHDVTGLVLGSLERRPDLTIVVLNDEGGGIFSLLEQGAAEHAPSFERVFGIPHRVDLAALCASVGLEHRLAATAAELLVALKPQPGLRVVEVRAQRQGLRDLHARLRSAVAGALR